MRDIVEQAMRGDREAFGVLVGLTSDRLLHLVTCLQEGIGQIVSPDRGFDRVAEIRRIDPAAGL